MSKQWKPKRPTVELRPSRIRRNPVAASADKKVIAYSSERETWTVVIGVLMFALAIAILTVRISDITSH